MPVGLAKIIVKNANLSTEIQNPAAIPYFLWDEPMNVAQLKARLRSASYSERVRLLGKILREARDTDVWAFTSPDEVRQLWPELCLHLGRRRTFWEFLFTRWQIEGFLAWQTWSASTKVFAGIFLKRESFFPDRGAALAGFHLGHRETHDLDLFTGKEAD
jgi:hypothetical protein